ncbi:MAG: hypothetical protein KC413_18375, partial [Anaerolineales bacterium]|nr:hypothetical protein [Anaerolineales bacterium]
MRYKTFLLFLILALVLVACGGGNNAATNTEPVAPAEEEAAPAQEEAPAEAEEMANQVEVFSWWTGGGEAAGLEAMIKVFNEK